MKLPLTQRLMLAWLALAGTSVVLVWLLAPVLMPFLTAAVLAYVLQPAVDRLSRRLPRALAVVLVELGAMAAALGVLLLIVPIISRELPVLRDQIPVLAVRLNDHLAPRLAQFGIAISLDIESIKAFVLKYFDAKGDGWLAALLSSARIGGSFLLAIIGEELGLIGVLAVILAFFWMVRRIFIIGRQAIALDRVFSGLTTQGIGLWVGGQSFINMGVNLGVLPTKGLTLPLLSYGGSAIILTCVALAVVLRVDMENRQILRGGGSRER